MNEFDAGSIAHSSVYSDLEIDTAKLFEKV